MRECIEQLEISRDGESVSVCQLFFYLRNEILRVYLSLESNASVSLKFTKEIVMGYV